MYTKAGVKDSYLIIMHLFIIYELRARGIRVNTIWATVIIEGDVISPSARLEGL